ncbi:MAG TPA: energy transducer TonB, partial [Thermoanaerobaculia bacterium]|nr:energy transducer TonB [Thermoanaerobaculia bacterium]
GAAAASLETATLAVSGSPLPDPLRDLLRRGLSSDQAGRERDLPAFRSAVNALLYGGSYSVSTFNLAFLMQQQFERAIQSEKREREAEEELGVARPVSGVSRPAPTPAAAPVARPPASPPPAARRPGAPDAARPVAEPARKNPLGGVPPWAVGAAAVVLLLAGGFLAYRLRLGAAPPPAPLPRPAAVPTAPPPAPTPVVVGKEDPLFQAALQARLQEELKRRDRERQSEKQRELRKREADAARAAEEARKATEAEDAARAARDRNDREEELRLAREAQEARKRAVEAAAAARAASTPVVREGDLLEISEVDTEPVAVTTVKPEVPPLAKRRKLGGTIRLRVLVNEKGRTEAVEILQDTTPKVGFGESSKAAVERWIWTPATKDGRKVRTWTTVTVPFVVQ